MDKENITASELHNIAMVKYKEKQDRILMEEYERLLKLAVDGANEGWFHTSSDMCRAADKNTLKSLITILKTHRFRVKYKRRSDYWGSWYRITLDWR